MKKQQSASKSQRIKQHLQAMDNALYYDIRLSLPTTLAMIAIVLGTKPSSWYIIVAIASMVIAMITVMPMLHRILKKRVEHKKTPLIQIIQQGKPYEKIAHGIGVGFAGIGIALVLPKTVESITILITLAIAMLAQYIYGYYNHTTEQKHQPLRDDESSLSSSS